MSDSDDDANKAFSQHPEFYGEFVTFLVEDCLFRVAREPFRAESTVFRDIFLLPQDEDIGRLSNERPIKLDGIAKFDFEQLLKVLFYRNYGTSPCLPNNVAQWTSVLKLSTLWEFDQLRKAAINALSNSLHNRPLDRFILSRQYDITGWSLPALNELAQRPESISLEEGNRLGIETALKIASVREHVQLQSFEGTLECNVNSIVTRQGGFVMGHYRGEAHEHTYTSNRLVIGSRDPATRLLEFTPLLRTTFNL
ncbi:hypothetical protein V8B97DRAFT_1915899 [Scleroderma yunnanense]